MAHALVFSVSSDQSSELLTADIYFFWNKFIFIFVSFEIDHKLISILKTLSETDFFCKSFHKSAYVNHSVRGSDM